MIIQNFFLKELLAFLYIHSRNQRKTIFKAESANRKTILLPNNRVIVPVEIKHKIAKGVNFEKVIWLYFKVFVPYYIISFFRAQQL